MSDLKEQLEHIQSAFATERESLEAEQNVYIQEIITMKLKVAESEMRASEKEFLYSQLKKKMVKAK